MSTNYNVPEFSTFYTVKLQPIVMAVPHPTGLGFYIVCSITSTEDFQ